MHTAAAWFGHVISPLLQAPRGRYRAHRDGPRRMLPGDAEPWLPKLTFVPQPRFALRQSGIAEHTRPPASTDMTNWQWFSGELSVKDRLANEP